MKIPVKVWACGIISNLAEAYDFLLYGVFAHTITSLFFPENEHALLISMTVFAGGFLTRPLGALVIGSVGDYMGRKHALLLSAILMSASTVLMGSLPTYAEYGIIVPILLVLCRLIQGFSVGGEFSGASIFVLEHTPKEKSGFAGSLVATSSFIGSLLAMGVATLVALPIFPEWGWRIAFWVAAVISLLGFYVRLKILDSPEFTRYIKEKKKAPVTLFPLLQQNFRSILLIIFITSLNGSLSYTFFTYFNIYFQSVLELSPDLCRAYSFVGILVSLGMLPLLGYLADRVECTKLMLLGSFSIASFSYPFYLMMQSSQIGTVLIALITFCFFSACFIAPANAVMNQLFPVNVRYRSIALGFNTGMLIFGGTTPMINTYLIQQTGNIASPGLYLSLCGVLGFLAVFYAYRVRNSSPEQSMVPVAA